MSILTYTPGRLYSKDMSELFEVSRMTICRMVKDGRLPAPTGTVGDAFFWNRLDIENFLVDGGGFDLVDTSRRTLLENPTGDPDLQRLIEQADELATKAEALMVKSRAFDQKLKLDLLMAKREIGIQVNQDTHQDDSWKFGKGNGDE